jgi:C4-dicarboxylate transporter/malic acid transport protein
MTSTATHPSPAPGLFGSPNDRRLAVANIGPNWFASVMGTSIVATAAATLPVTVPGLRAVAQVVWVLAGLMLLAVSAATVAHWRYHPDTARGHASNPVMAHFYGAPPMGLLAFGVATHLVGVDLIGAGAALGIFAVLWVGGTAYGLVTAVGVPYLVFTRHDVPEDAAFGGWLMPVVPPMVSAATGALLVPELPAGQWRTTLFTLCWSMFGLSLLASLVVITLIWGRLARHKVGAAAMVPTLWIVLGPLGQSITAANNLGTQAHVAVPEPYATAFQAMGLVYGLPVWGFALMWAAIAAAVTIRTARAHLPFGLTWWSFTFPVGTVVTGTSGLALHTGEIFLQVMAVVLFAGLLTAWATVAIRTTRGVFAGNLL